MATTPRDRKGEPISRNTKESLSFVGIQSPLELQIYAQSCWPFSKLFPETATRSTALASGFSTCKYQSELMNFTALGIQQDPRAVQRARFPGEVPNFGIRRNCGHKFERYLDPRGVQDAALNNVQLVEYAEVNSCSQWDGTLRFLRGRDRECTHARYLALTSTISLHLPNARSISTLPGPKSHSPWAPSSPQFRERLLLSTSFYSLAQEIEDAAAPYGVMIDFRRQWRLFHRLPEASHGRANFLKPRPLLLEQLQFFSVAELDAPIRVWRSIHRKPVSERDTLVNTLSLLLPPTDSVQG
ncbi:hypothetical protein B0H13DRAFT_2527169 [Mycena leptocephala]|nr:hypothetical protein B0H13DRAFT_2527169 [Mycena leptocephala]